MYQEQWIPISKSCVCIFTDRAKRDFWSAQIHPSLSYDRLNHSKLSKMNNIPVHSLPAWITTAWFNVTRDEARAANQIKFHMTVRWNRMQMFNSNTMKLQMIFALNSFEFRCPRKSLPIEWRRVQRVLKKCDGWGDRRSGEKKWMVKMGKVINEWNWNRSGGAFFRSPSNRKSHFTKEEKRRRCNYLLYDRLQSIARHRICVTRSAMQCSQIVFLPYRSRKFLVLESTIF